MNHFKSLIFIALIPFLSHCSDKNNSAASGQGGTALLPAAVDAKFLNGECLNLEGVINYINDAKFTYPAVKYVRDFKLTKSNVNSDREKTIFARAVTFQRFSLSAVDELAGLKQSGCDFVTVPLMGNIVATYKIADKTPQSLRLEFVPFDKPMMPARPQGTKFVEAFKDFPMATRYEIHLPSQKEMVITMDYRFAPNVCAKDEKIQAQVTEAFQWHEDPKALPESAKLQITFLDKLKTLFPEVSWTPGILADSRPASETEMPPILVEPASALVEVPAETITQFSSMAYSMESACVF